MLRALSCWPHRCVSSLYHCRAVGSPFRSHEVEILGLIKPDDHAAEARYKRGADIPSEPDPWRHCGAPAHHGSRHLARPMGARPIGASAQERPCGGTGGQAGADHLVDPVQGAWLRSGNGGCVGAGRHRQADRRASLSAGGKRKMADSRTAACKPGPLNRQSRPW